MQSMKQAQWDNRQADLLEKRSRKTKLMDMSWFWIGSIIQVL